MSVKKITFLKLAICSVNVANPCVCILSSSATAIDLRFQKAQTSHGSIFASRLFLNSPSFTSSGHFSCVSFIPSALQISESITPFCCSTFLYESPILGLRSSHSLPTSPLSIFLSFLFTLFLSHFPCAMYVFYRHTNIVTHVVESNLWLACC